MYGWRARIGKVEPSRGDTYQYEFYQMVPKGVVLVVSIIGLFNLVKEELNAAWYENAGIHVLDIKGMGIDKPARWHVFPFMRLTDWPVRPFCKRLEQMASSLPVLAGERSK